MEGIDYSRLHESERVILTLPQPTDPIILARALGKYGGKPIDGFVDFPRSAPYPVWQSQSFATVDFASGGHELNCYVDDEDSDEEQVCDQLIFDCLIATLPSSEITRFLELVDHVLRDLGGCISHNGQQILIEELKAVFDHYLIEIAEEVAEVPGSEFLRILIEESYPRRSNT